MVRGVELGSPGHWQRDARFHSQIITAFFFNQEEYLAIEEWRNSKTARSGADGMTIAW